MDEKQKGRWVMTERKRIQVRERTWNEGAGGLDEDEAFQIFDVGDPVPPGHEGRPYTKLASD